MWMDEALAATSKAVPGTGTATSSQCPRWESARPYDAHAVIYCPAPSVLSAGRRGRLEWMLEFKPRIAPFIEPLMGWTGSMDTLCQVRLRFPSREAAIVYAEQQNLRYCVYEPTHLRS
jgi:hypothetical protein